ncbi:hypothetical protein [Burkholderia pseudomallei]|uniref:hypothetical protein n=1 Tax=Burkholderia pseudomallei TaxID=28450 RepID=UPI00126A4FC3|nr:hypothetical protein [Burkholderia pseudomallei]
MLGFEVYELRQGYLALRNRKQAFNDFFACGLVLGLFCMERSNAIAKQPTEFPAMRDRMLGQEPQSELYFDEAARTLTIQNLDEGMMARLRLTLAGG